MPVTGRLVTFLELNSAQFTRGITQAQQSLQNVGVAMNRLGRDMTQAITIPIVAAGAAALKFGTDFEDAFTGVRKTVEGTPEQLAKLSDEFKKLSTEIPVSATELSKIGEIAGQLGIPIGNIKEFTQVIAELGDATVLSTSEAAEGLAQFIAGTGGTADRIRDLGNVLVKLGNNFATNEAIILDFAKQMGGTAASVGVTQEKILALSAALANVGINVERGASAISQVFVEMDKAVALGGEKLQTFAEVMGTSAEAFQKAFREDAARTVGDFIVRLGQMQESGQSVAVVLDALSLDGLRVADTLKRAAQATDAMNRAFQMASEEWEGGSALAEEVAKRYETISSQLKILRNNFELAFIDVFEALKPILHDVVIPLLRDFVERIKELAAWFKELPLETQKTIVKWVALAAAFGPVLTYASKFVFAIKNILALLPIFGSGLGKLAGALVDLELFKSVKNFGDLRAAMALTLEQSTLLRGGLIGLAAALAGLGTWKAIEGIRKLSDESTTLNDILTEQPSLWDNVLRAMNPFQAGIEAIYRAWRALQLAWDAWSEGGVQGLWEAMTGTRRTIEEASLAMAAHQAEVTSTADGYLKYQQRLEATEKAIEAGQKRVEGILPQYTALKEKLASGAITAEQFEAEFQKLTDTLPQAGGAAEDTGASFDNLGKKADAAAQKTEALVQSFQNSLQPAQALEAELNALREHFSIEDILKIYRDRILETAAAHRLLNGPDSLPKTVEELANLAAVMALADEAIRRQNEVMTPWLNMLRDMGVLEAKLSRDTAEFTRFVDELGGTFVETGFDINEGLYRLADWKVEVDNTSDVLAASERSIEAWARKQEEATKRGSEFAKNWNNAWSTAVGNVVGKWMDGLLEMRFNLDSFIDYTLNSVKDLGKTLLKLVIGSIFEPILAAATRFGQNLGQTITGWLFGGGGPSGGLFGGIFDMFTGGRGGGGGGLFGNITGLFTGGGSSGGFNAAVDAEVARLFGGTAGGGAGAGGFFGNYSQLFGSRGIMGFLGPGLLGAGIGSLIGDELGGAIGGGIMTALAPFLPALFSNPLTAILGGGLIGASALKGLFTNTPTEAGMKEIKRDFGISIQESVLKGFLAAQGIAEKAFEPFRKSILGSPIAFEKLLLPAAQAQGNVDALVAAMGRFAVSPAFADILARSSLKFTKGGGGFLVDLSEQARLAAEGNFAALNEAFLELFQGSGLSSAFGDLSRFLSSTVMESVEDLAKASEQLASSTEEVRRSIDRAGERFDDLGRRADETSRALTRGSAAIQSNMFGFDITESWVERQRRIYGDLGTPGNRPEAQDALPGVNIFDVLDQAAPGWDVGSFQRGGRVPRTGYGFLHEGEMVLPADRDAGQVTVVQHFNIYSPSEDLARVTREKVIPMITRELNLGSTPLRTAVVRTVSRNSAGVNS